MEVTTDEGEQNFHLTEEGRVFHRFRLGMVRTTRRQACF
jgi:hypothetical protein